MSNRTYRILLTLAALGFGTSPSLTAADNRDSKLSFTEDEQPVEHHDEVDAEPHHETGAEHIDETDTKHQEETTPPQVNAQSDLQSQETKAKPAPTPTPPAPAPSPAPTPAQEPTPSQPDQNTEEANNGEANDLTVEDRALNNLEQLLNQSNASPAKINEALDQYVESVKQATQAEAELKQTQEKEVEKRVKSNSSSNQPFDPGF